MNTESILGVVRHILTAAAGVLVTKGLIDAGQAEIIAGAVAGLIGVAWSIFSKKKAA